MTNGGGTLSVRTLSDVESDALASERWQFVALNAGDVYYQLPYLEAASIHEEGNVFLCHFSHPQGEVLYPLVLRPLSQLPFTPDALLDSYDAITPYEYGGPLVHAQDGAAAEVLRKAFDQEFIAFCRSEGIVCEFVRFHPLLRTHEGWDSAYEIRHSCANVIIDLTKTQDEIVAACTPLNRRNLRTAQRRNIAITKVDRSTANVQVFADLYMATMDRLGASPRYYFSREYFEKLCQGADQWISLYLAIDGEGTTLSGALVIHGSEFAHYHLGGTAPDVSRYRPNNLLYHTIAMDQKLAGRQYFHLGGAASSQEGLLAFKAGFSRARINYQVGWRIHDQQAYASLSDAWTRTSLNSVRRNSDSFPAYRA
jgi:hypothetical protein